MMWFLISFLMVLLLSGSALAMGPQAGDGAKAYAVLRTHCLVCHDKKLNSGKLLMETTADLLKGGANGPAIVPGKSGESRLIKMIVGEISPRMPLEGELKKEEIEILRHWIDAGAPAWTPGDVEVESLKVPDVKPTVKAEAQVSSLAFSPDARTLAVAGYKEVRLLDATTLKLKTALRGPTDMVRVVAYSPDGKMLAAAGGGAGRYGEIILWDTASGQLLRTLRGHRDHIYSAVFSLNGKYLATSSYDRLIKIWDVALGTEWKTLKEHTDAVFPLAFSPDGRRLASGGADRTLKIWDAETGRRLFTLSDSTDVVYTLAFHPSGERITASGGDKYIRTWRLAPDGGTLVQAIIAHEAEITRILYFPDGKHLVSTGADRSVKIWNMDKGEVSKILEPQPDWVLAMAISPDGKILAVGRYDGSIGYYNTSDWHPVRLSSRSDPQGNSFLCAPAPGDWPFGLCERRLSSRAKSLSTEIEPRGLESPRSQRFPIESSRQNKRSGRYVS